MARYYVHRYGDHEVHKEGCSHLPWRENRIYLGQYESCKAAVREAKKQYPNADGCYYCSNECHTG